MHKWTFGLAALTELAAEQAGIVSRPQVVDHGLPDSWLQHQLRAKRWQRVHTGVYATFTGDLSWAAQCWAALLYCGEDAALAGMTALHRWHPGMPGIAASAPQHDVVVAVAAGRRPRSCVGIDVWTLTDLERYVHPAGRPRLLRCDVAVLLTASRAPSPDRAIAVIADACQSRRTTPGRLLQLLGEMPANLRFRGFIQELLADVATGAYSFLEVHYLRDVERPHGLPTGKRQRRVTVGRRPHFRDVEYLGYAVIAELDGRLGHEDFLSRANDMDRDTDSARTDARTARIGYLQTMSRACFTAQRVVDLLRLGGWTGHARHCGPGCTVS